MSLLAPYYIEFMVLFQGGLLDKGRLGIQSTHCEYLDVYCTGNQNPDNQSQNCTSDRTLEA